MSFSKMMMDGYGQQQQQQQQYEYYQQPQQQQQQQMQVSLTKQQARDLARYLRGRVPQKAAKLGSVDVKVEYFKGDKFYQHFEDVSKDRDQLETFRRFFDVQTASLQDRDYVSRLGSELIRHRMIAKTDIVDPQRRILRESSSTEFSKDGLFIWKLHGSLFTRYVLIMVIVLSGLCLASYPFWPAAIKPVIWYTNIAILSVTLGVVLARAFLYLSFWGFGLEVWIFPNLNDDTLSFLELFLPIFSFGQSRDLHSTWTYRLSFLVLVVSIAAVFFFKPAEMDLYMQTPRNILAKLGDHFSASSSAPESVLVSDEIPLPPPDAAESPDSVEPDVVHEDVVKSDLLSSDEFLSREEQFESGQEDGDANDSEAGAGSDRDDLELAENEVEELKQSNDTFPSNDSKEIIDNDTVKPRGKEYAGEIPVHSKKENDTEGDNYDDENGNDPYDEEEGEVEPYGDDGQDEGKPVKVNDTAKANETNDQVEKPIENQTVKQDAVKDDVKVDVKIVANESDGTVKDVKEEIKEEVEVEIPQKVVEDAKKAAEPEPVVEKVIVKDTPPQDAGEAGQKQDKAAEEGVPQSKVETPEESQSKEEIGEKKAGEEEEDLEMII